VQFSFYEVAYSEGKYAQGVWWQPGTIEGEVKRPGYIPYSELLPALREIEKTSNRVQVEIAGKSAGGHDILLVTISEPSTLGRLGYYKSLAKFIEEYPEKVLQILDQGHLDFKSPVYLNPSIHGGEMGGVDAALQLIRELAYENSEEVQKILNNLIIIINPCPNPDGRIANKRTNDNGFDLNRDCITASQPEMQVMVSVLRDWNPLIDLNAHGYMDPGHMLIEPCTIPHCPNAQMDKIERWLYPMALEQEKTLNDVGITVEIPYRDYWAEGGWDDYPPTMFQMYAYYHGSLGQCSEAPRGDILEPIGIPDDILAHYVNMKTGLLFAAEHRVDLLRNQLELFLRGKQGYGWKWTGPAWNLPYATIYEPQGFLYKFPYAYLIPMDDKLQVDPIQAAKLVDHLIFHGIKVTQAVKPFYVNGVRYPAGTYVVLMSQAKSGLANCLLWSGENLSYDPGVPMYDDAAWNFPELWGVTVQAAEEKFCAKLVPVKKASYPEGELVGFPAKYVYALKSDTNNAINMVNELLNRGITVGRTDAPFTYKGIDFGVGTFIIPANQRKIASTLNKLAKELHLKVYGIDKNVGISYYKLKTPKIAVLKCTGVGTYAPYEMIFMLKNFGFKFDVIDETHVQGGLLANYDVLYVPDGTASRIWTTLGAVGQAKLMEFINEGGRYIGVGEGGAGLLNYAKFLDATAVFTRLPAGRPNGVARVNYNPFDPVTAYYPENGYAFVYYPVRFTDIGSGVKVAASLASEDMLLAGYWPGYEAAQGDPIIIHGACGNGEVILIGTTCNRRAHLQAMYRILTNAIYC